MNFNYNIFFTIELLHEYFLNRKCNDLEIKPAKDCMEISRRINIQWRNNENQLMAFIKENDVHEPFINTPPEKLFRKYYDKTVFRFYIKLKDPLFLNYTNIDPSYGSRKKFYFSNIAKNKDNGMLYLTTPVKDHSIGTTYFPGTLVRDPVNGNVFESIKKHISKKKTQLSDTQFWVPKGLLHLSKPVDDYSIGKTYLAGDFVRKPDTDNVYETIRKHTSKSVADLDDQSLWISRGQGQLQYPTDNDIVDYCNGNYVFKVSSPVAKADIAILGFNYNAASPAYEVPVGESEARNFEKPATEVNVNLSSLGPGKYKIKINEETKMVYYDSALKMGDIFGVVEIFNHLPGTDDYALLTADEKIRSIKYQVQFPNRRVLWKYIRKDGKARSITDMGDTGYIFKLNGEEFVSATPIPLSESALKTLKLEFNTKDFSLHPLPNPSVQRLKKFTQNEFDYFCSEVYLNY